MKLQSKEKGERKTCNREVNQTYGWALYIQMIPFCQPSLGEVEIHSSLFHLMTTKQADKNTKKTKPRCQVRYLALQEQALVDPSYFCKEGRASVCRASSLRKFLQPPA